MVNLVVSDVDSGNMQVLIMLGKGKKDRCVNLPESIQHVFKNAMNKSKINKDVGIHGLRHSFATHLLENGTDISYIQHLLGHSSIKTTMIYARVAQKNVKNVKSPLDNL